MKRDLFYVWFLPLLWCGFTTVSYFHPGDENALFFLGSIAGTWGFVLFGFRGPAGLMVAMVIAVGMVVVGLGGLMLDMLRVRKRLWFSLFVVLAVLLFIWQLVEYGSLTRMTNKNRYVAAVVVAVCNWSLYLATFLSIAAGLVRLLVRKVRGRKAPLGPEVISDE